jgi:hypothetical protein
LFLKKVRKKFKNFVLFVQSLSPPKPAGLDPPNFCRHTPNWLRNTESQKKLKEKLTENFLEIFFGEFFFGDFFTKIFHENAERSIIVKFKFFSILGNNSSNAWTIAMKMGPRNSE